MEKFESLLSFLKSVTLLTVSQMISVFGILFIFGLLLYLLARSTRRVYQKSTGSTIDIILTGWIGTPVHEMGHALFCLLFFHKIQKIRLFHPDPEDGTIGYVLHSYNRNNIYQRIGNFFIGIGPIILGSLALYAAMYFLVPNFRGVFSDIERHSSAIRSLDVSNWQYAYQSLIDAARITLKALGNPSNFSHWQFWVFIYLSMSIASHMELSPPDIKNAFSGFLFLVLLVFVLNVFAVVIELIGWNVFFGDFWKYLNIQTYMAWLANLTGLGVAVFIYATIISMLNFLVSWVALSVYTFVRYGQGINPFWGD